MSINAVKVISYDFDTANLLPGFLPVNAAGFPGSCFLLRIINDSNSKISISYDGINDHDFVLANSNISLNFQGNAGPSGQVAQLPAKTVVYVASAAANAGTLVVSCYYQPNR